MGWAPPSVHEIAVFIEAALQHDGVPVGNHGGAQPVRILRKTESRAKRRSPRWFPPRFGEIPPDEIEDEPADLGEELSVMAEKHSQAFGQTERHESVWKTQEKIILGVLGEQEGSFLGTGRAEMEAFATEGTGRPRRKNSSLHSGLVHWMRATP